LRLSLDEDVGDGDVTSRATIAPGTQAESRVVTREQCTVAGVVLLTPLVEALAARPGYESARQLRVHEDAEEGDVVEAGSTLCRIDGDAHAILTLERTLLNFVGRLSGIATETARFVAVVHAAGAQTKILDTRKTTPGHRVLEKYAVRCGGGTNHRLGLFDAVLIKDNHIAAAGGVRAAVERAIAEAPAGCRVEVECDTMEQAEEAIASGAGSLLLDNFSPTDAAAAVKWIDGRARIEISGGVTIEDVAAYARAGVDEISVGRLTHSAHSIDVSMEIRSQS
jgi:nicotinate-nucleotide pyrophosphorylase (carboxylating)